MKNRATRVAIHQPNYFPWLGYFSKILSADVFIFLDDVQYSKNSYINRVRVRLNEDSRWLTVPVRFGHSDLISEVHPAEQRASGPGHHRRDWKRNHIDQLSNYYDGSPYHAAIMPIVREILESVPEGSIADINRFVVEKIAALLMLECRFVASSELDIAETSGNDRLIALTREIAPNAHYLSGRGGAKYLDPDKFTAAGLGFGYLDFRHPVYYQGIEVFVPGLSVLDALFRLGADGTKDLLGQY